MLIKTELIKLEDVSMAEEMEKGALYRILVDSVHEGLIETINYKISALQNGDLSDKEIEDYIKDIISDLDEIREYLQKGQEFTQQTGGENV